MAKRYFQYPYVLLSTVAPGGEPGDDGDSGYGSGLGTVDPCSWTYWMQHYPKEWDDSEGITENDYYVWWRYQASTNPDAFNQATWSKLNGNMPYPGNP